MSRAAPGVVYTPHAVAERLAAAALDGRSPVRTACDPAAGDGRLLAAVAAAAPTPPALYAADLDDLAWRAGPMGRSGASFVHGDSLCGGVATWPDAPPEGFDLVVANPPFLTQMARATAADPPERARRRAAFGSVAAGYADAATLFLVAACEMAADDGRVAVILPLSFLTARDAGPARRRVLELATLDGIWVPGTAVFPEVDVQVCALVLDRRGPRSRPVRRWRGAAWDPAPALRVDSDELSHAASWAAPIADLLGALPEAPPGAGAAGRLGDIVSTTAGFRDQFYGLAPLVRDAGGAATGRTDGLAPMVTSGMIEPGRVRWGETPTRIAGGRWSTPAIDPTDLAQGSSLARWVEARRRPKVVLATQTRVLEAAPDPTGEWIPSTPVVAVHTDDADDLWRALAVLLAPPVTLWALTHFGGAALTPTSIKLSASQVREVPLPADRTAWDRAAEALHEGWSVAGGGCDERAVGVAGAAANAAYGADPAVGAWWAARSGILLAP